MDTRNNASLNRSHQREPEMPHGINLVENVEALALDHVGAPE